MKVIINADDFGLSESINDGIVHCFKQGIITSASLMVNTPYTEDAVSKIKENDLKNIGVHLNVTYGKPVLSDVPTLTESDGKFHYVCSLGYYARYEDCVRELSAQIDKFLSFGLTPSHIDYHHYLHQEPQIFKAYIEVAKKYNLPARAFGASAREKIVAAGIVTTDGFSYDFHDYDASSETLARVLEHFSGKVETLEIMATLGYVDDYTRTQSNYGYREVELEELQKAFDEGVFKGVQLISFNDLKSKN